MKKRLLALFIAAAFVMGGCSQSGSQPAENADGTKNIEELNVAFAPYDSSETMLAETEPMKVLLQDKLLEKGYNVEKRKYNCRRFL